MVEATGEEGVKGEPIEVSWCIWMAWQGTMAMCGAVPADMGGRAHFG